jgi:carbonic anhydrase
MPDRVMTADDDAEIEALFANNRRWAAAMEREDPGFFSRLVGQQQPQFLWIGCSDSRVPANQITGLAPGEVFVHRNVANVVSATDLNCMSVVDFAVRSLRVRHIIVCGHYGCAGVRAASEEGTIGVTDAWLSGIRELHERYEAELDAMEPDAAQKRLCELNVREQVRVLSRTTVLRQAWKRGQRVDVHGWIYGIEDGLLRDLGLRVSADGALEGDPR